MPMQDHAERLQSASRAVGCYAERLQCVDGGLQEDLVVIDDQDVHRLEHHILPLPIGNGKIQDYGEGRSFTLLALAVYAASHQIDHLLCDGQSEPGALNTVHPAVCLARKRLIHVCHKFRTHADAGIRDPVGQPHTAGLLAFRLAHVHADTSAGFRVFNGIGKDIDVDLIQPKLVGVEIFFFHPTGAEIELDILFLDHRLGEVHEIFHRLDEGEGLRAEIQLSALDLGNVQDIVDQGEQMIAGQRDLPQIFSYRFRISEILFRDRREADDRVHRRADIVGHCRKKIGFRFVGRRRFPGRRLELLVEINDHGQIKNEQDQESGRYNPYQQPVFGIDPQILHRHETEKRPSRCGADRGIGEDTFLTAGVEHGKRAGRRSDLSEELLRGGGIDHVVRLVKLKETGILEGMALDDVVSVRVDHGKLDAFKLLLREDPFLLKLCKRQHTQQDGFAQGAGFRIMKRDMITEGDGLFPVDRVRIGTGNVDGFPDIGDPAHVVQKTDPRVGDGVVAGAVLPRSGRQAGQRVGIYDMRGGVRQHVRDPNEGNGILDGHVLAVDIACPHITDALFTLQIILSDMFHSDCGILKMLFLP